MEDGIRAVTVAPGQRAAARKAEYVEGVAAAADKWAQRVASVTLQDWQQAMLAKGVGRVAAGVQAAQGKFAAFMSQLLPYAERVSALVSQMPKGTLEDSVRRAEAAIRAMSEFRFRRGS
jgi:hypothetical protein